MPPSDQDTVAPWQRRRATRVWPVLGSALALLVLAVLLVPSVRAQAELSLTRKSPEYVELSAAAIDPEHVGTTCGPADSPDLVAVSFTLGSHFSDLARVRYVVRVFTSTLSTSAQLFGNPLRERVRLQPGAFKTRTVKIAVPRGTRYVVDVRLPETGNYLRLHCDGLP